MAQCTKSTPNKPLRFHLGYQHAKARGAVLETLCAPLPLAPPLRAPGALAALAARCDGFSGADLQAHAPPTRSLNPGCHPHPNPSRNPTPNPHPNPSPNPSPSPQPQATLPGARLRRAARCGASDARPRHARRRRRRRHVRARASGGGRGQRGDGSSSGGGGGGGGPAMGRAGRCVARAERACRGVARRAAGGTYPSRALRAGDAQPISPYISLYLPTSPYISLHLPMYLTVSHFISSRRCAARAPPRRPRSARGGRPQTRPSRPAWWPRRVGRSV